MAIRSFWVLAAVPLLLSPASAADAGEVKDLCAVYEAYNAAVQTGNVEKMLSFRTAETEKDLRGELGKKEDREYFVLIAKAQVPETYDVQHVSWTGDGNGAELHALWHLPPMKEIKRFRKALVEVNIPFRKERGAWKIGTIYPLGDPAQIKRPKDLRYRAADADTGVTSASVAGRIVKLEFKPDHTLVLVRVMGEEVAVFLPPKKTLDDAGVSFDDLAPWKMREFTGYPHKSDTRKFFATGDSPID